MYCKQCFKAARKIVYTTFEYWYCDNCKIEVEDTGPPPSTWKRAGDKVEITVSPPTHGSVNTNIRSWATIKPDLGNSLSLPKRHVYPAGQYHMTVRQGEIVEIGGVAFPVSKNGVYYFSYHESSRRGLKEKVLTWHLIGSAKQEGDYGLCIRGQVRVPA